MTDVAPPALFFHPDAVETPGKDLVGRRAAGQSFARGWLQHMPGAQVSVVTQSKADAEAFNAFARSLGETRRIEAAILREQQGFAKFGAVFFPTPGFHSAVWQRARTDPRGCSLIGITHTVSTRKIIEGLHHQMLQPVHPWDAIICTSRAVQSVVQRQFEMEAAFIRARFGATRVPQPLLPLVPLGIQTADFASSAKVRAALRDRYETPANAVVIMTLGRLTSVEKANPVALFQALEKVARAQSRPVELWMVGWASREQEQALHQQGAALLCPTVRVRFMDGRAPDIRRDIWSGADIFTLPVDNIQETFGLVPLEAMAAGLPVVMPDWNGFRDTVVDGVTGFLIPTMMPPADQAGGAMLGHRFADETDDYLRHLAIVQQQTVIDAGAYAQALLHLVENADLRARMGQAGQAHARQNFDWQAVIPQYRALADELARIRSIAPEVIRAASPIEGSPFAMYQAYPTGHLQPDTLITPVRPLDARQLHALDQVNGRALYGRKITTDAHVLASADMIAAKGALSYADFCAASALNRQALAGIVLFLAKYDFVTLTPPVPK